MKTNFQTILLILLLSCTSPSPKLDKPKDFSDVLQEVKSSQELKQNPKLQSKIVNTIQEQTNYSQTCYAKIQELEARLTKLENENLKEELATWRKIQFSFWLIVGILIFALIVKFLAPIVRAIWKVA